MTDLSHLKERIETAQRRVAQYERHLSKARDEVRQAEHDMRIARRRLAQLERQALITALNTQTETDAHGQ